MKIGAPAARAPRIAPWLIRLFSAYAHRYVAKHFHAVRLLKGFRPELFHGRPVVAFLNHASWWDPLTCLVLARSGFPGRPVYAPIEAAQLERYRFFRKLGFFGVEPDTRRGAATFLRVSLEVLAEPNAMLWLTPQGRFVDARERPVQFKSGLAHLATRLKDTALVPLAIEYAFWQERTPEALACFGDPVIAGPQTGGWSVEQWSFELETRLAAAQDRLALASTARQADAFKTIVSGSAGVGGWYDRWRRGRARWAGRNFDPDHGSL